jgi:holo-[acyl-carrier protein] synthase
MKNSEPMIVRTGVDLIEIDRVAAAVSRHGDHYLGRIYTPAELDLCGMRIESLAGRFVAKEAVAKVLGCGIGEIGWQEIEILRDEQRCPVIRLNGAAATKARELGLNNWSISISHSKSHAISVVVAMS